MATIETIRPELGTPRGMTDPVQAASAPPAPDIAAFRAGRTQEDRLTDLLAYGLLVDRGDPATPDAVDRARQEAGAALSDFAFRYLHNTVEQVRREAVTEHLGRLRQPPGFLRLVLANLVALVIAGVAGWWLALHPQLLAGLSGLLSG